MRGKTMACLYVFVVTIIILIGNHSRANDCDYEDLFQAEEMRDKYQYLYNTRQLTLEKYLMSERFLIKTKLCAGVISSEEYCEKMANQLDKIKYLQPIVYKDEMEDYYLKCR